MDLVLFYYGHDKQFMDAVNRSPITLRMMDTIPDLNYETVNFPRKIVDRISMRIPMFDTLKSDGYERAVYLDSDIIVNSPIDELFDDDFLEGNICAMAEDLTVRYDDTTYKRNRLRRVAGSVMDMRLKFCSRYHNSGVIALDLTKIGDDLFGRYKAELKVRKEILELPDQDFLNIVWNNQIKLLDPYYNSMADMICSKHLSLEEVRNIRRLMRTAAITHYHGEKPWMKGPKYRVNKRTMQHPNEMYLYWAMQFDQYLHPNFVKDVAYNFDRFHSHYVFYETQIFAPWQTIKSGELPCHHYVPRHSKH